MSLSRAVLNSLLPEGAFWTPAAGDDYDLLLNGIADNSEALYQVLKSLADIRSAEKTPVLSDLEAEYGIIPASLATEAERRSRLEAFIYRRAGTGAWDLLQSKLREAGFDDVYVHPNDPAVDPNIFLAQAFNMVCGDVLPGGNAAQCGEPEAICAQVGGELVVNGDLFLSVPNYVNLCGEPLATCDATVQCGDFDGYKSQLVDVTYQIPTESGYWPLIFFVGGPAERRWRFLNEAVMNLPLVSDALDISGNGNNGTATNITWTGGVANFNGTTSKITSTLTVQNLSVCTISFKFDSSVAVSLSEKRIINTLSTFGIQLDYCRFFSTLHQLYIKDALGALYLTNFTGLSLNPGTLKHLTIIIDGANVKVYIDNVLVKNSTHTSSFKVFQGNFEITGASLSYKMSNFYIFNRALTDEERTALYTDNAQTGGDGELSEIEFYNLPIQRRLEFRRTILKFKPMHSWGGLIVVYN